MATYADFYNTVLRGIGLPANWATIDALSSITATEGRNTYYNPMNIEWHPGDDPELQGYRAWNDAGVQMYRTITDGILATGTLLNQSHWSGVRAALRTSNYDRIIAALTAAYTWARFNNISEVYAHQIATSSIGTSTNDPQPIPTGVAPSAQLVGLDYAASAWATMQNFSGSWSNALLGHLQSLTKIL